MSILNDKQILELCGADTTDPMIHPCVREQKSDSGIISYGPSSFGYDMRAGNRWRIFTDVLGMTVDPKNQDPRIFHDICATDGVPVIIPPNSYALTHTVETISMPRDVTAICLGKSTYARCGIHVNVTPLEAGWRGQVTVEISNGTRLPVKVYPGEGIMQVLFFRGADPAVSYADRAGKYQDQAGVTLARVRT